MRPDGLPPPMVAAPRRARRVALLLAGVTLALAAAGGWWFVRFAGHVPRDPGGGYPDPTTPGKALKRATHAAPAGHRATAITTYPVRAARGGRLGAGWAPSA